MAKLTADCYWFVKLALKSRAALAVETCSGDGMIVHHTPMPKTKVALTIDTEILHGIDDLVAQRRFRNRSQAVEAALKDNLRRLARTRLARECANLDPKQETALAEEGLAGSLETWPEY